MAAMGAFKDFPLAIACPCVCIYSVASKEVLKCVWRSFLFVRFPMKWCQIFSLSYWPACIYQPYISIYQNISNTVTTAWQKMLTLRRQKLRNTCRKEKNDSLNFVQHTWHIQHTVQSVQGNKLDWATAINIGLNFDFLLNITGFLCYSAINLSPFLSRHPRPVLCDHNDHRFNICDTVSVCV